MSDSLAFLIGDSARLMRRKFDARARSIGVSRAQWQVLFALSRNEGTNQAGLAEALDVETITVGRMVDRLEDAGLVERRADPADRRAWRLHLTARAHPVLDELRDVAAGVMADVLAGIDANEQEALASMLVRIRANALRRDDVVPAPRAVPDAVPVALPAAVPIAGGR